jgi:hypothetical protein
MGNKVLVEIGAAYTDKSVTVILTGNPTSLANKIQGKQITFLATMLMSNGKPQMEVKSFSQVPYSVKQ